MRVPGEGRLRAELIEKELKARRAQNIRNQGDGAALVERLKKAQTGPAGETEMPAQNETAEKAAA